MEASLQNQLLTQQEQQRQLIEQINALQYQLDQQTQKIQTIKTTRFDLSPDQIIRNFNEIPPFSGEDSYKLQSFLKSIMDTESLCGRNNEELREYCLKKLINTKIIGSARSCIMEIPEQQRTWTNVIRQLRLKFRPKNTIHQLLFQAKNIKVFNLKDLFNKLNKIKSDCSEVCDYEDEDTFTYCSIDRELVYILKSKIVPIVQLQIDTNKTLFELDNILCQSEIYLSEEIIKTEYKIDRNIKNTYNDKKVSNNFKKSENNLQSLNRYNHRTNNNHNNHNNKNYSNNHFGSNNNNRYNDNHNNNNNYNGQFRRQSDNRNGHFSGQYRNPYNRQEPNYSNRQIEPMEVDNITNELNQEVNFIEQPRQVSFR